MAVSVTSISRPVRSRPARRMTVLDAARGEVVDELHARKIERQEQIVRPVAAQHAPPASSSDSVSGAMMPRSSASGMNFAGETEPSSGSDPARERFESRAACRPERDDRLEMRLRPRCSATALRSACSMPCILADKSSSSRLVNGDPPTAVALGMIQRRVDIAHDLVDRVARLRINRKTERTRQPHGAALKIERGKQHALQEPAFFRARSRFASVGRTVVNRPL